MTKRLLNNDPRCRSPDDCRATGSGLCRSCAKTAGAFSAARKAAWADPAVRARMSAARKAAWADPAVRARMSAAAGWLTADQRACVIAALAAGQHYRDIARDWLLSYSRVTQIAGEAGIWRRGGRAAPITPAQKAQP